MTYTCFIQADILYAKHYYGCRAEEEGERKRGRGAGGADYIKAEYARRMAALEEALQAGPLWATDEDEADARALAEAEELVEQVRLLVPRALQGVLRLCADEGEAAASVPARLVEPDCLGCVPGIRTACPAQARSYGAHVGCSGGKVRALFPALMSWYIAARSAKLTELPRRVCIFLQLGTIPYGCPYVLTQEHAACH